MKLIENILNIFFPPVCGFCNKINSDFLCEECRKKYDELKISNIDDYSNVPVFFNEHYYVFKYENEIREAIIEYKFNEKSYLYKTFSRILLEDKVFMNEFVNKYDVIISVPIHKRRMKIRGYNQSKLIAKDVSNVCGVEFFDNVLVKSKNIVAQSSLDMLGRIKNIKDAFDVGGNCEKIIGKRVAVFDDIFTTGSTANECARVLKEAGASYVGIFTLAKD